MKHFTVNELLSACHGTLFGDASLLQRAVSDVVIDSRKVKAGAVYVPIIGDRFDGHTFIPAARENGAMLVLSAHPLDETPYIRVDDTLSALQQIASAYRDKFAIPVIGITGSVGKTSTKEMVAAALSSRLCVVKTVGSENNQTGVPLTIFRFDESHDAAIVEMGTNHFGEIDALSQIAKPDICLFTNIGVAHIEFFGSREGILRGKTEMLAHMRPNGEIIVNGDDDLLQTIPNACRYGFSDGCDVVGTNVVNEGLDGMTFTVSCGGESMRIHVPAAGVHSVSNALAAIAVGRALHLSLSDLRDGIAAFSPPSGRLTVNRTRRYTVLNDAYNANPDSMMAALDVLSRVSGRKVCILGDMFELGAQSERLHEMVGAYASTHGADLILCVGRDAAFICRGAESVSPAKARQFATRNELHAALPDLLKSGDTILVKASHGMHLEETVALLLKNE